MTLPIPQGAQREVVTLTVDGHVVVLGTAGSGKTTMAIHRAVFLANVDTDHGGRTLLVTFNRTLVTYLEHLRPPELTNVDVRTYHHFARGYLKDCGLMSPDCIVRNEEQRRTIVAEAVAAVAEKRDGVALLRRPTEFFATEIQWINQHGMVDEDRYVSAERVGRSNARLTREQRPSMFEVYRGYLERREREWGKCYDWDDLAIAVHRQFAADNSERLYRHVVIDEGQDFSPEMIRSLAQATPPDGSLTMFGDVAQQIYGRRVSWSDAGLGVEGRVWRFEHNYRNSPQIAALGLAIAAMPYFGDEPDMVEPTGFAAEGPPPALVRFDDSAEEAAFVIEQARQAAQAGSVAILVRRRADLTPYRRAFPQGQRLHREMLTWNPDPGVSYGTYHSAKGLEFDTVILPGLSLSRMPEPELVAAVGDEEAMAGDGRLLYVGVTRARRSLVMTYSGELTELMPARPDLWQELSR